MPRPHHLRSRPGLPGWPPPGVVHAVLRVRLPRRPAVATGAVVAVTIEERLAAVEAELAAIRERLDAMPPPKRDPASAAHLTTDRAWTGARRAPAHAFGFTTSQEEA